MFEWTKKLNARIAALPFFPAAAAIHKSHGQKILSFLCLFPLFGLTAGGMTGALGPEPWLRAVQETGEAALSMLLLCLSITPLMQALSWNFLYPWRRTFGLFAFFYAVLHAFARMVLLGFDWESIAGGIFTTPFLLAGFLALMLLIPLAVTSSKKMMVRLGRRWKLLHRLVYVIAILGVAHALMSGKVGYINYAPQAVLLAALLGWRLAYPFLAHRQAMQKTQG